MCFDRSGSGFFYPEEPRKSGWFDRRRTFFRSFRKHSCCRSYRIDSWSDLFRMVYHLGWSYYGERCWVYLCGQKAIMPFRIIYTLVVFVGSVMTLDAVWGIADILNACMAFPNLIALLGLSGVIVAETKKYLFSDNMDGWSDDEIPVVDK